jgi:hypothetical protein
MRLAVVACVAAPVAAIAVGSSASDFRAGVEPTYAATCAVSTAQWPADARPRTTDALTLGPAVFNHLRARDGASLRPPVVLRPQPGDPLYHTVSYFNVLPRARRGVVIRLVGGVGRVAILYDGYRDSKRLTAGQLPLAKAPRSVRFPLCQDHETKNPQITQYGISFLMRRPGCFTVEVQPVGQPRRYRATLRVLASHC